MARCTRLAGAALLSPLLLAGAFAAEPGKDHPLVGRYEGAVLDGYKAAAYDEVGLIKEPFQNWGAGKPDLLRVEGKVTLYLYRLPSGVDSRFRSRAANTPASLALLQPR